MVGSPRCKCACASDKVLRDEPFQANLFLLFASVLSATNRVAKSPIARGAVGSGQRAMLRLVFERRVHDEGRLEPRLPRSVDRNILGFLQEN